MPNTRTPKPCYPAAPLFSWFGLVRDGKIRYDQMMTGVHVMFVDQTNEEEISRAIMLMRRIDWIYMDFFRKCLAFFSVA